jgi:transcription elongation factor Elf1
MGYYTIVTIEGKSWMNMECENCGINYRCFVQASAQSDDTLFPISQETLEDFAKLNYKTSLEQKANTFPCPRCGAYPQTQVQKVTALAGRVIFWLSFLAFITAIIALIYIFSPTTPFWSVLIIVPVSYILARITGFKFAPRFDPNLDLRKNLDTAEEKMKMGSLCRDE